MDKPITILFPNPKPNTYLALIEQCIKDSGFDVLNYFDVINHEDTLNKAVVINLNWYASISNPKLLKYMNTVLGKIKHYFKLKKYGVKIIYTFHNALPHDTKHKYIDRFLMKFCLSNADRVVVLSNSSREALKKYLTDKKIHNCVSIINHLSLTRIYRELNKNEKILNEIKYRKSKKIFHCLFFGTLKEYKNIELIIRLAEDFNQEDVHFIIAGNASNHEYKDKLINQCNILNNISIIPRFIADEEVIALYDWSDISVCPLNLSTSINSGSMILSFGFKRSVIGSRNGTMKDFPLEYNYSYEYNDEKEHYEKLKVAFLAAYNDWKKDSENLLNKGEMLYNYLESNYSYEITKKKYEKLYNELFEREGGGYNR